MRKFIISALFLGLIIPSLVSAAWWNPSTWFRKKQLVVIVQPQAPKAVPKTQPKKEDKKVAPTKLKEVVQEKVVETPKPTPVIAPVIVPPTPSVDPKAIKAQQEYETYIRDSENLQIRLAPLRATESQLHNKYIACSSTSNQTVQQKNECREIGVEYLKTTNEIREIQSDFAVDHGMFYTSPPTAICNDGTYSYSKTRSGTCSWHDGVYFWYY